MSDFGAETREAFLEHLRGGMRPGAAAYVLKVPKATVDGYMAENPGFALAVREAEETATEHVDEAVYQAAVSGNVQAARLWYAIHGRAGARTPRPSSPDPGPADDGGDDDLDAAMRSMEG